ncbi:ABC transporter permease [Bordetella bronchialis]|uniref:ABC transporter permease n=1 Tax=Bordetella bronchialis TaxID=463025 RepID=A0A193FQY6_9BORD|nr:ABC transporter permease [Bordetella bronchialis]ANN65127.1 ABC transporter permease [Bordetella bronchialis]ANN70162.1 ABC transporter permease [Bordetella bronchialis]
MDAEHTVVRRRGRFPWARFLHRAFVALMYLFMLCPLIVVVWLSFFKDAILYFPPSGYTVQWYVKAWANEAFANGFVFSLQVALLAAVCGVALGVMASLGMMRYRFAGASWVNTMLLSPLLVPGIVAGIAIYLFYLRAENFLDRDIVGTYGGLVIAHVCLTIPWTVRLVSASMAGLDPSIEEAARNLGASGRVAFMRITLPMLRPAIVAAALFSFIVSFENLELSLSLVGPGRTTLPIAIMQYLEFNLDPTIAAVSSVQILLLGLIMLATDRFVKLSQVV